MPARVVPAYAEADRPAMIQEVAWRFGTEFGLLDLFDAYEDAVEARGEDMAIWDLAYNESDLEGWTAAMGDTWQPTAASSSQTTERSTRAPSTSPS